MSKLNINIKHGTTSVQFRDIKVGDFFTGITTGGLYRKTESYGVYDFAANRTLTFCLDTSVCPVGDVTITTKAPVVYVKDLKPGTVFLTHHNETCMRKCDGGKQSLFLKDGDGSNWFADNVLSSGDPVKRVLGHFNDVFKQVIE